MTHADKVKEFYREQGRTEERERIIRILKIELTGNDQMLEELIYLINDVNVL